MSIEVTTERVDYRDAMVLTVDEEGSEALHHLFENLAEDATVMRSIDVRVVEDSEPFRIRFESKKDREERLRQRAEADAKRRAEAAAAQPKKESK